MIFELALTTGLIIIVLAFIAEYFDSSIGMGYGTTLTPILLLMGYEPLQVVPAVLLSELCTGLLAGFTHHSFGNVDFRPKTMNVVKIWRGIRALGVRGAWHHGVPHALKVAIFLAVCSIVGTVGAVFLALNLPKLWLNVYIGILITLMGIVTLLTLKRHFGFSWPKVGILGLLASFNKGISGGGYGPIVTGGQIISGVDGKNAVAITSLAEGLTCLVGVIVYVLTKTEIDWVLAPYLAIGAIASVPLSVLTVHKMHTKRLQLLIGVVMVFLGIFVVWGKVQG